MSGGADFAHIAELFSAFGAVSVRRMFGGAGIFADGLMVGLVHAGVIYLKADERTIPAFEREKLGPFSYPSKTGTRTINTFWRMPERLYDDPDELAEWTKQALDVARRTAGRTGKGARSKRRPKRGQPRK